MTIPSIAAADAASRSMLPSIIRAGRLIGVDAVDSLRRDAVLAKGAAAGLEV